MTYSTTKKDLCIEYLQQLVSVGLTQAHPNNSIPGCEHYREITLWDKSSLHTNNTLSKVANGAGSAHSVGERVQAGGYVQWIQLKIRPQE